MTVGDSFLTAKDNGTVPRELKEMLAGVFGTTTSQVGFATDILNNMVATEMYLNKKDEEPKKWECKTVCEMSVTPGE